MELLAPAGNFECLKVAVASGANAVYLAGKRFGARANAENFDDETLRQAVEFAHLRGVRVHMTVNTLLREKELDDAVNAVRTAADIGVDAFIVQDLGLVARLRRELPHVTLHASTQMGICNVDGARFAASLGIRRVVLARETLPEDIEKIKRETALELEMFVHGALCVAYSGNCYYSSLVSGCSGNRGRCLQLCRKPYETEEGARGYYLSAKDICLLDELDRLRSLGIDSLKIEGRMRTPEYVHETVSVYRAALDGNVPRDAAFRLKTAYNRGDYCKAYLRDPTENVIYAQTQNHIGVPVGRVCRIERGKAILSPEARVCVGDGIKFLRGGQEAGGGTVDGFPATGYRGNVRVGDEVRLTSRAAVRKQIEAQSLRIDTQGALRMQAGEPAVLTLSARGYSITVSSDEAVDVARSHALTEQEARDAVGELGGTDFIMKKLQLQLSVQAFFPVSSLKALRKRAVKALRDAILADAVPCPADATFAPPNCRYIVPKAGEVYVQVARADTLRFVDFAYDTVLLAPQNYEDTDAIRKDCEALGGKALLCLPYIVRGKDAALMKTLMTMPVAGFVVNNVGQLTIEVLPILCGLGVNRLNATFLPHGLDSIESDATGQGIGYAFGKPPLMQFAHCPRKSRGKTCSDCHGYDYTLRDDKGAAFRLCRVREAYCYAMLIPQLPVADMAAYAGHAKLYDLTYASEREIAALSAWVRKGTPYTLPCTHGNLGRRLQ